MDKTHYKVMKRNFEVLIQNYKIQEQAVYLFGHCNASEVLADLFIEKGYKLKAILDNNDSKRGTAYKGIPIVLPCEILKENSKYILVCIAARASAAMEKQLRQMGYKGAVEKLIDYNSYAEYSFSEETVAMKQERVERGIRLLKKETAKYPGCYRIYCPFSALGDVYYMMSYLPYFLEKKAVLDYVVFTIGNSCGEVVRMFGAEHIEVLSQTEMDESIQAVLYTRDANAFIPHQDRPYVVNLAKALYVKMIPLELIYKYGVFGLSQDCIPYKPVKLRQYRLLEQITPGKAVILSPYAKSVTNIPMAYWNQIVKHYKDKSYQIFTNISGDEEVMQGTSGLKVSLAEVQSVAERAGTFIGLRSGLCDVLKEAACKKIALYPDCYYSDTKWKMEEIYYLDGWENVVVS